MVRLLGLLLVGSLTWGLVVLRGIALEKRRTVPLGCIIVIEEYVAIALTVWFARHGDGYDIAACAFGGACAAMLLVEWDKRRNRGSS